MKRICALALLMAVGLGSCHEDTTGPERESAPGPRPASSQAAEGRLHVVWGDPAPPGGPPVLRYELVNERGRAVGLKLTEAVAARFGGPKGLDRRMVRVEGVFAEGARLSVRSIQPSEPGPQPVRFESGSQPYVTILCKFAGQTAEPHTLATYRQWTAGATYPGLNHWWREVSYGIFDVAGSVVVGWYTLPQPQTYYGENLDLLAADCTAAADADVNFPQYTGINLQFNASMPYSYGGSWSATLDGELKYYRMTWLASWADLAVYAHQQGHSIGLGHSSGGYGALDDSDWDVMSNPFVFYDAGEGTWIPQHTNAWNKYAGGWIGENYFALPDTRRSITLQRLASPGAGPRMALIPLIGNDQMVEYTVEARRRVGSYDSHLPGDAVVIHLADQSRWPNVSTVVDADNDGDPNDAGAMWTVGESFSDTIHGVTVTVDSMTATGFGVTITRLLHESWVSLAPLPAARSAFGTSVAGGLLYAIAGRGKDITIGSVYAYDPAVNRWTRKASLPSARRDLNGAVTLGGRIYVAGGRNPAGALTRTLYVYDPVANTWSTKAQMPIVSGCGGSVALNARLYVFTGCDANGNLVGRLHRYIPSTNTWTARAAPPGPHGFPAVGEMDGLLYVAGGHGSNGPGVATATLHVYNPVKNTWTTKAPMPAARTGAAGQVLDGLFYVIGGSDGWLPVKTVFVYDPTTNRWSTRRQMPTARMLLGSAALGGRLYAVGGQAEGVVLKTLERYVP